jgi:transcriptional regulator with XRE-family HTH domain
MLTPFGKLVRKRRIDAGVLLKEMADGVGLSSAFLSAVETGRKPIPPRLVDRVAEFFNMDMVEREELTKAADLSARDFKIMISRNATASDRTIASMLARNFPTLTPADKEEILKILERKRA